MALTNCSECNREISDKAAACPGCGAPLSAPAKQPDLHHSGVPSEVYYDTDTDAFTGTMILMVKLAMRAVHELGWKLDQANENLGLVTFQTAMSFGSFSGVSCSLSIEEVSASAFRVSGTGKQNNYSNLITLNLFGEAEGKARKAIEKMQQLAGRRVKTSAGDARGRNMRLAVEARSNAPPNESAEDSTQMAEYGITFDGEYYHYDQYRYERFSDALAYAEVQEQRKRY